MMRLVGLVVLVGMSLGVTSAEGQMLGGAQLTPDAQGTPSALADTSMTPGKALLFELEAKFAKATAEGGGKAFASWFAEDGVSLGKGLAAVHGRENIAKRATWLAKDYRLQWTPTDGAMSAGGDMGYTWGHYEGHSKDAEGNDKVTAGRYLNLWRREADGSWKVVLDQSSDEPAGDGDCCRLPAH
jgi:uncharacterized protein (TIGR02246 family)